MTMDEHVDCDRRLNEAEDRIKELEKCLYEKVLLKTSDVICYERSRMKVSTRLISMIQDIRKDVEQALKGSKCN